MEGFGNAFLEAIYYRRPIVVNNYSIYAMDIKPKGFHVVEFDGLVTAGTIEQVRAVLDKPQLVSDMVEHNYQLAVKHYSFSVLEHRLKSLLLDCFGEY
jgi:glycosyltransferase involved in cell wall biosynthesis